MGTSSPDSLFEPMRNSTLTVKIPRNARGTTQSGRIDTSFGAIREMMLFPRVISTVPVLELYIDNLTPADTEVWISQASPIIHAYR